MKINLGNNNLTGASLHHMGDIISHLHPQTLVLYYNSITTNLTNISTAVISTSTVKMLNMMNNDIPAQEAAAISDMIICLEDLYISDNKFGDHGAEMLSVGIRNTKTLRNLDIRNNNIGPLGTTAIANALTYNTSLEELDMYNPIGRDGAVALGNAIAINEKLNRLLLCRDSDVDISDTIDKDSAMIIIRNLYNNHTVTEVCLPIALSKNDIDVVIAEAEKINSQKKLQNEHIVDFFLLFIDLQDKTSLGKYNTEQNYISYFNYLT